MPCRVRYFTDYSSSSFLRRVNANSIPEIVISPTVTIIPCEEVFGLESVLVLLELVLLELVLLEYDVLADEPPEELFVLEPVEEFVFPEPEPKPEPEEDVDVVVSDVVSLVVVSDVVVSLVVSVVVKSDAVVSLVVVVSVVVVSDVVVSLVVVVSVVVVVVLDVVVSDSPVSVS